MFGFSGFAEYPFASLPPDVTVYGVGVHETVTTTEVMTVRGTYSAPVIETTTLSDTSLGPIQIPNNLSEVLTLTDAITTAGTYTAPVNETTTVTALQSNVMQMPTTIAESTTLSDSEIGLSQIPTAITESTTLSDAESTTVEQNPFVYESITITSVHTSQVAFVASATALMQLLDLNRTTGWYSINNAQTTTWVPIDDTQA